MLIIITCLIVIPLLLYETHSRQHDTLHLNRTKRQAKTTLDHCLKTYGGVELDYVLGSDTTFQFDLCSVINCGSYPSSWRGYDVYVCAHTNDYRWCPTWDHVIAWSGVKWQVRPCSDGKWCTRDHTKLVRGLVDSGQGRHNPMQLTLKNFGQNILGNGGHYPCGGNVNSFYFILGVDQSGTDTKGLIKVNLVKPSETSTG